MKFTLKRQIYESLPRWLVAPVGWAPFSLLAGSHYREALHRGPQFDRATRGEVLAWQEAALGRVLRFACEQVPAYTCCRGLVERFRPFEALKGFPLLEKSRLQMDLNRYLPQDFSRIPHYECTTGGTSGSQLRFYVDDQSHAVEAAFMHRQWARVGYSARCRKATFRGVEFGRLRPGVYWRPNPVYNELQFSPYHMCEATLGAYWKRMLHFRPEFIHGYPSAVALLAEFVLRHGLSASSPRIRAALLGSEGLLPGQRELIESAFRTRVYTWYGHSERIILAGECEQSPAYHHFPDYGILEMLDEQGRAAEPYGERAELIGTGLLNRSLVLIRYRTGDWARRLPSHCACGRAFDRFDNVEGRWQQEYLVGKSGSNISLAALNMHGSCFRNVIRYQYYQCTAGIMELRLMVSDCFDSADETLIREALDRKTGPELDAQLRIVDNIPLTKRGKLRRLIQDTPPQSNIRRSVA